MKRYGINTIRIPIAWSNMMVQEKQSDGSTYYRINEAYFDRVEEVINYCLNEEMYVIINDHWDGQWWGMFGDADLSVRAQAWKKYEDMWTPVSYTHLDVYKRQDLGRVLAHSERASFWYWDAKHKQYWTLAAVGLSLIHILRDQEDKNNDGSSDL